MSTALTDVQKSELKAYMSLIGNTLVNCELYLAWVDHAVANEVINPYMSLIGKTLVNCELYLAWVDHAVANEVIRNC